MSILETAATEYRNLPLAVLTESNTNPRRTFDDAALKELAESIRTQGVLSPLLVRPLNERTFEIVFGARRYRAAQIAEAAMVPVRIANLTDAQALEAQLVENLVSSRCASDGRGAGIRCTPAIGGTEILHRTDRGPHRKESRVRSPAIEADRAGPVSGGRLLSGRDRCWPRTVTRETPVGTAGAGPRLMLSGRVGGCGEQAQADSAAHPSSSGVD